MQTTPYIIDLSDPARLNKLLGYEDITDTFTDEEHRKLVDYVHAAFEMSHAQISKRYPHWKKADEAHDVYVKPEATKFREKAVIADTRAVADTVLTYMMAATMGRNPIFQLEGNNRTSRKAATLLERVLHRDMRNNMGEAHVAQIYLDSIRYGFAPTKVTYNTHKSSNMISNFDPRRAFPDPRVTWGKWDQMQYIGFADHQTYDNLVTTGDYPYLQTQPQLRRNTDQTQSRFSANKWRKEASKGYSIDPATTKNTNSYFQLAQAKPVNELWVRFSGHDVNLPNLTEIWLLITVYNEDTVIRFQLNPEGRRFPIVIGGMFQDFHKTYSQSLYDVILPLHDIATWLLRSRVDNVQAALNNLIFADPTTVNISDIINRNAHGLVRTLPGTKPGDGVLIQEVPDVTRGHWNDIMAINDQKQRVAASSDAQQGMPTAGIRSATEVQRMSMMGTQRLGHVSKIISSTTIRPMAHMMIGNIQDAISYESSLRIDPYNTPGILNEMVEDGYIDFSVQDLQGNVDYLVVDGTLPTEATRNPENWMNAIQIASQTGLAQEYKIGMMAEEAFRGMGIHDLDKFRITPQERTQGLSPSQQFQIQQLQQGNTTTQSQEHIEQEVQRGNLVPMSEAG